MTDQDALKYIKDANRNNQMVGVLPKSDIGKCVIQALEKQIPKKPCYTFSEDEEILASCEICDSNIDWTYQGHWRKGQPKYCRNCGQKIDWSDEE